MGVDGNRGFRRREGLGRTCVPAESRGRVVSGGVSGDEEEPEWGHFTLTLSLDLG